MSLELVAVMGDEAAKKAAASWDGAAIEVACADGLGAVLTKPSPKPSFFARLKGDIAPLVSGLVDRQRLLEHLLSAGDVLPAEPGQSMSVPTAAAFLGHNIEFLRQAQLDLEGQVQFQLTVAWDPAAALRHFADQLPQNAGQGALGLAKAAETLRQTIADRFLGILDKAVVDRIAMPEEGAATIVNTVLLVRRSGLAALDLSLEEIDAFWSEGLQLKLVGPLPPLSFALLVGEAFGPAEQASARAMLGMSGPVPAGANPAFGAAEMADEIDRAFRKQVMSAHPDRGGAGVDLAALGHARDLLKRSAFVAPGAGGNAPFLFARLRRDDQARTPGRSEAEAPRSAVAV